MVASVAQRIFDKIQTINWWRVISTLVLGILLNLITDTIFGLIYMHNDMMSGSFTDYVIVIVLSAIMMAGVYAMNDRLEKRIPWHVNPLRRFGIQTALNVTYILFCSIGLRNAFNWFCEGQRFICITDELIVAAVSVTLTLMVIMADMGMFMLKRWRDSVSELERFKKESIEFKFEMLKNQVNPHFLFNSLNTLSSLIFANQETAAQFVRQLAKVYRYVLENRERELITMAEEMTCLESYRYLVEMRFAPNLKFEIDVPAAYKEMRIVPMTLQMLIENAIKHNIVSKNKPLTVRITATPDKFIHIANNFQPKTTKEYSSGLGLKNIVSRYGFLTDRPLEVTETATEFKVKVPLID
jgi:hypothetical protein